MSRIVCFGEALIDFHAQAAREGEAPAFVPHAGGAPANVAVAVARLGGASSFVGMFGRDLFADMLQRELGEAGVDLRHALSTDAANTALAFVARDARGERSFSFYRPPAADLLFREDDFDAAVFADAAFFHAGSCSLTEPAIAQATLAGMRRAREAGVAVSFDMNLRPALWPRGEDPGPRTWRALDLADLVKLSREEMDSLAAGCGGDEAAIARLWQGAARWLIVTDGSRPLRWHSREVSGEHAGFVVRAVDCTGAGDAFVGGLLHGLAQKGPGALDAAVDDASFRERLLRRASACGALATTRIGSYSAMPSRDELARFLSDHP